MSLPSRLYNLGCLIAKCELVRTKIPTDDNRLELQRLLNETIPVSSEEATQRELVRGIYYSNQTEFTSYVNQPKNRVRALIYWTESKQIARALGLLGKVHIKWAADVGYTVDVFVPRNLRPAADNAETHLRQPRQARRGAKYTPQVLRRPVVSNDCCEHQNEPVSVEEYLAQPDSAVVPHVTLSYSEAVKWCDATD